MKHQILDTAARAVRDLMAETNTTIADLVRAGIPEMTARRFLSGENTTLVTYARIVEACGARPTLGARVPVTAQRSAAA